MRFRDQTGHGTATACHWRWYSRQSSRSRKNRTQSTWGPNIRKWVPPAGSPRRRQEGRGPEARESDRDRCHRYIKGGLFGGQEWPTRGTLASGRGIRTHLPLAAVLALRRAMSTDLESKRLSSLQRRTQYAACLVRGRGEAARQVCVMCRTRCGT